MEIGGQRSQASLEEQKRRSERKENRRRETRARIGHGRHAIAVESEASGASRLCVGVEAWKRLRQSVTEY